MGSSPARLRANASRSINSRSSSTSRIRIAPTVLDRQSHGHRQGEPHARPAADLAVDTDAPAVGLHDALGDRQAQANPRCAARVAAYPIEPLEQPGLLFGRNPRSVVVDADAQHISDWPGDHPNL